MSKCSDHFLAGIQVNNSGKSSILYALRLAFANHNFISQDDFFTKEDLTAEKITVDILIVPSTDEEDSSKFTEDWEGVFTTDRITTDSVEKHYVPFRTTIEFEPITNSFKRTQFSMQSWPGF